MQTPLNKETLLQSTVSLSLDSLLDTLLSRESHTDQRLGYKRPKAFIPPLLAKQIQQLDPTNLLVWIEPPNTELNKDTFYHILWEITDYRSSSVHFYRRQEASQRRIAEHERKKQELELIAHKLRILLGDAPEDLVMGKALKIQRDPVLMKNFLEAKL